ncbi:MAG TPA: helix-turn-helix domain-containing protein [Candidatus Binatia bacterium]|nr:helix-turn-helix domain-containing protein [Candidatus Binatia bacterium]
MRAAQVGQLLGIDRSTVYRMAEQGRLPAVKVGHQWRFVPEAIHGLLAIHDRPGAGTASPAPGRWLMESAVQLAWPMIELAAQILGVMIVATDMAGEPVAKAANPCQWFSEHTDSPELLATCLADWKQLADDPDLDIRFRGGPQGLDCARVFVRQETRLIGMLVAGCVAAAEDETRHVYRLSAEGRAQVLSALPIIAARVSRVVASSRLSAPATGGAE